MHPRPARRRCSRRSHVVFALALALAPSWPFAARLDAAQVPTDFVDELILDGLDTPVNFDFLPDGRMLLVEQQSARLRLVVADTIAAVDPVGTIADVEVIGPEQGLLGVAVDPRWPTFPYVYVFHSAASKPNLRLSRYVLLGDLDGTGDGALTLDPASRRDILTDIPDDYPLHNGGTVMFGPDGMLYVGIGEDGIPCAAQDIHETRGKILRLNIQGVPAGPGPAPSYQSLAAPGNPWIGEFDPRARVVWQRGLRNPFSFDFDLETGEIAIADVGSNDYEEVDLVGEGGHNFGWPLYEGPRRFDFPCSYADTGLITPPTYWYQRTSPEVEAAVLMGGVCRRAKGSPTGFPTTYNGDVFIYDLYEGSLRRLRRSGDTLMPAPWVAGQPTLNAWATGLLWSNRMRFGPDGMLWYFHAGTSLRRISYFGDLIGAPTPPAAGTLALSAAPVPARGGNVLLSFAVAAPGPVDLAIFDVSGRLVRRLLAGAPREAGPAQVAWDGRLGTGSRAPAGVYLAVVSAGGERASRRVILMAP